MIILNPNDLRILARVSQLDESLRVRQINEPSVSPAPVYASSPQATQGTFQCTGIADPAPAGMRLIYVKGACSPWANGAPPTFTPQPPTNAATAFVDSATRSFRFVKNQFQPDYDKTNWLLTAKCNLDGTVQNSVCLWYIYMNTLSGPTGGSSKIVTEIRDFAGITQL